MGRYAYTLVPYFTQIPCGASDLTFSGGPKVADVDAKLASMRNVEITLGPISFDDYIPGWRTVWIRDPDGRIIETSEGFKDN